MQQPSVTANAAHEALARLEAARPGEVMIATQNIDDLHERAGSRAVILFAERIYGPASRIVPDYVARLLTR